MQRLLTSLLLFVALGVVVSWSVATSLIAPTYGFIGAPPEDLPGGETIALASESGATLAGWHFRAADSRGVVVMFHGVRASRLQMETRARFLLEHGYSVVAVDFQAHGESTGEQITMGYLEQRDVAATLAYARGEHPAESIGVIGASLGGVAAVLALPLDIDALVVESVYPDIRNAVANRVRLWLGPLSPLPTEILLLQMKWRLGVAPQDLRPVERIAGAGCPVLILSGSTDVRTTVAETRELFAAAVEPKELWIVEGAPHVDLYDVAGDEYATRILRFLDASMKSAAGPRAPAL